MDKLALLKKLQKYKLRILAVTVFLVIFSPIIVVTYLSSQEQLLYIDDDQWNLSVASEPITQMFPKYYKVVLESIDDASIRFLLRCYLDVLRSAMN